MTQEQDKKDSKQHDSGYKLLFSHPELVRDFLLLMICGNAMTTKSGVSDLEGIGSISICCLNSSRQMITLCQ